MRSSLATARMRDPSVRTVPKPERAPRPFEWLGQRTPVQRGSTMQREGAEIHRFAEPGDASRAMPGLSLSVVPLGSGPYVASLATVRVGEAALHLCRSSPFMGFAKTDADSVRLQLPLENADSLVLNGVPYQSRTVGAYGGGAEFLLASQKNSRYAAIILPSGLVGRLLEPPQRSRSSGNPEG